jgi:hypothetical protein
MPSRASAEGYSTVARFLAAPLQTEATVVLNKREGFSSGNHGQFLKVG